MPYQPQIPVFGTDGVRGLYLDLNNAVELEQADSNQFYLTEQVAFNLGKSLAELSKSKSDLSLPSELGQVDSKSRCLVIGADSRPSGQALANALAQGWLSLNSEDDEESLFAVEYLGVVPTPLVAFAVQARQAAFGAVISASHNPVQYNGIKFFTAQGQKIERELERKIIKQYQLEAIAQLSDISDIISFENNLANTGSDVQVNYISHCCLSAQSLFGEQDLSGVKIVLDCANGAAYHTSPTALRDLGAELVVINDDIVSGVINDNAGSTHIERLSAEVKSLGADIGLAHDGDADRTLAVDATGNVVDGDAILYLCAKQLLCAGKLAHNAVVGTVMTNLGVIESYEASGIRFVATDVGDSKVYAAMKQHGYVLGGEQSGHIIFGDVCETGDGLLTALCLLGAITQLGFPNQPLHEILQADYQTYPQVLINVLVRDKKKAMDSSALNIAVSSAEVELNTAPNKGRVLVRASGTEDLIRVMVEANSDNLAKRLAKSISTAVS